MGEVKKNEQVKYNVFEDEENPKPSIRTSQNELDASPGIQLEPGGETKKVLSNEDKFNVWWARHSLPTSQQLEADEKKLKRDKLFATLGDGIRAISNLVFTTKGAPNMYNSQNNWSDKVKQRWEQLQSERKANNQAYIEGLERARRADAVDAQRAMQWQRYLLDLDYKNKRAEAEDEYRKQQLEQRQREFEARQEKSKKELEERQRSNQVNEAIGWANVNIRKKKNSGNATKPYKVIKSNNPDNPEEWNYNRNTWEGNWNGWYNELVADIKNKQSRGQHKGVAIPNDDAPSRDKEDFLLRYWRISPEVATQMRDSNDNSVTELDWGTNDTIETDW